MQSLFQSVKASSAPNDYKWSTDLLVVWALYPESNQRTLEEMDMLFAADTPWVWDAESTFARLKESNPMNVEKRGSIDDDGKRNVSVVHAEKIDLSLA